MTKKVPKKILRIERNFFVNLIKKIWPPTPRRRRFFWTGGAPPPPAEIDRRAAAHTMTSAHSSNYIKDQFAFRPTGSTTAAVIDLLQQTTTMLLTNDYVDTCLLRLLQLIGFLE